MKYFYINNIKINYIPNNRSIIEYCENLGINIPLLLPTYPSQGIVECV